MNVIKVLTLVRNMMLVDVNVMAWEEVREAEEQGERVLGLLGGDTRPTSLW